MKKAFLWARTRPADGLCSAERCNDNLTTYSRYTELLGGQSRNHNININSNNSPVVHGAQLGGFLGLGGVVEVLTEGIKMPGSGLAQFRLGRDGGGRGDGENGLHLLL